MSTEIILQQTPDAKVAAAAILAQREQLAAVRLTLADRESDLVQLRAKLKNFENEYFRKAGILYADLDELEARIAEREVDLYDSDSARRRAEESRQRAKESHAAALDEEGSPAEEFDPPPSLKTLFRELAKRIHPDFARDAAEGKHFTLLMARANLAYRRGDIEILERLLEDYREVQDALTSAANEGPAAELRRITRQIQHAQRDLATLESERHTLLASEIGLMYQDAEAAALENRDFLAELAAKLREQISDAEYRFQFVDRQIKAHGR